LATETLQLGDPCFEGFVAEGLLFGESRLSASFVFLAPPEEHTLREVVLATDLGGTFLSSGYLPTALELELPGVVSA
jgi:hypothetical protein